MVRNIGREIREIRAALVNSREDLVAEPRITAAALAHLLITSKELLQNLLIDTARRPRRIERYRAPGAAQAAPLGLRGSLPRLQCRAHRALKGCWNPRSQPPRRGGVNRTGRIHGRGEHHTSTAPSTSARARANASACGALARPLRWGVEAGVPRLPAMASAFLCCPIRRVVVLVPAGSSKPSSARLSLHFGSQGRAVQTPRLMPLRTAQAVARKLQARHIGLVAVF